MKEGLIRGADSRQVRSHFSEKPQNLFSGSTNQCIISCGVQKMPSFFGLGHPEAFKIPFEILNFEFSISKTKFREIFQVSQS